MLSLVLISTAVAKPKVRLASDGFPTGQDTPEGAASDLARAFMSRDAAQFRKICIPPYGGGQARVQYTQYLNGVADHLKPSIGRSGPDDPEKILTVFAARHLSKNGPASWGYAAFDFREVMFVDVEVRLNNGRKHMRRTLVVEDNNGKWYVQPMPDVDPLLSYGLYDESPSTQSFADVYEVGQ